MSKPRALDLFAGAGGVSVGLERAGFDVTAVDIRPQPRHRGGVFVQADALTFPLEGYDFIWASPPCQAHSSVTPARARGKHQDLVGPMRARLAASGVPCWVIENVPGAPLLRGFTLCASAFGLEAGGRPLRRHRLFEPSWAVLAPPCNCDGRQALGVYGKSDGQKMRHDGGRKGKRGGYQANLAEAREAMGIDWMNREELSQAIPPAYATWIGLQCRQFLERRSADAEGAGSDAVQHRTLRSPSGKPRALLEALDAGAAAGNPG